MNGLRTRKFYSADLHELASTSSKGAQPKWITYDENTDKLLYVKQDYHGYESISEWVVYTILNECSLVPKSFLVPYHLCLIDDTNGCYSYDYKLDEDEIPFGRILLESEIINKKFLRLSNKDKLEFILDILEERVGCRPTVDLKLTLALDAFFLNEDRHFNNVAILIDTDSNKRLTPYFDNGLSLLSRTSYYDDTTPITAQLNKCKPVFPTNKFKVNVGYYDGPPILIKSKIETFINNNQIILGRVGAILRRQLRNPDIQHLFIKESHGLKQSKLFT